jgi:hypothetical protein
MVGDADSDLHFRNDLSRIYQHLEPLPPHPIFERRLLKKEDEIYGPINVERVQKILSETFLPIMFWRILQHLSLQKK